MTGYGSGMGWGWVFGLLVLVGLVLLVLLGVRVLGGGVSRGNAAGETRPGAVIGSRQPTRSRACEILDERYARGELSTEVYYERLQALGEATF